MQKMVVNGVEMLIEQYPYLAQVVIDGSVSCGGAIISHRVIATAGHCIYDIDEDTMTSAFDMEIYLGNTINTVYVTALNRKCSVFIDSFLLFIFMSIHK